MTTTSTLILLASSLLGVVLSTLMMLSLKPLIRLFYTAPPGFGANLAQLLKLLWLGLIFVAVWACGHFLSRDFGIPINTARLCIALSLILPMGFFAIIRAAQQDRLRREAKSRKRF